ncbi:hypothetical protein FPV67DRAFT_1559866 [Lyophyllum atratum]|nr:hypothetical protein FPV67DRAFT_1559866 [Lyophyllum atratum]
MHSSRRRIRDDVEKFTAEFTTRQFRSPVQRSNKPGGLTVRRTRPSRISRSWVARGAHRARIDNAIRHAWRDSTAARYENGVTQLLHFAAENNIPLHECLPASEDLLCAFAASFTGTLAGKTISNKCSGIRKWHIENNVPYLGGLMLKYVVKGSENLRPLSSIRPQRPAVTEEMLDCLQKLLEPNDPFDACVLCVALTSFWGQIRLGEFLAPREVKYITADIPKWSDLKRPNVNGSRVLHLPRTKTGGKRGENVIITRQVRNDAIAALDRHRALNFMSDDGTLAAYRSSHGSLVALTKRKFLIRCNAILKTFNFPTISGHCFRIGGTTYLLLAGVPPDIVKLMGRWSSESFLRYWRSLEIIAPLYAELLTPVLKAAGLIRPSELRKAGLLRPSA